MKLNALTPEEEKIIVGKGTEAPFSGEYEKFNEEGIYVCRRCEAPLYRSEDKFDAHCGWPSFDAEILGAVKNTPDADGMRTEISCIRCGAHLGHVFTGEKMTPKDVRYCVNSVSMKFVQKKDIGGTTRTAYFGGGCFWCTEATFKMIRGVISVIPGYAGGKKENPTYEEVSTGTTEHAETVKVEYDSVVISYEALLEVFFNVHDPTSLNQQGGDVGTQYRSIIFYEKDEEKDITERIIRTLEEEKNFDKPIMTEVKSLQKFYEAEEYHRDYFLKHPEKAYCQAVIAPKVSKIAEHFEKYLK